MKRMKKAVTITIITALLVIGGFSAGVYASNSGWLSYTETTAVTEDNVSEIMTILRGVHADKISAEEALAELERLDPPGLAKKNKELREYIAHLESELQRAIDEVRNTNNTTQQAVEEARELANE